MRYTEKEKKAIENVKIILNSNIRNPFLDDEADSIDILLNLLEKYQKEIDKKDKRIFYLEIEARKIIEQNIDKEKINIYENYISKDKIIEKIKEIADSLKEDCIALHEFQRLAKIDVLKELLGG